MPGKIFIVAAPSGAGKTTLVTKAIKELSPSYKIERAITYTSRLPRIGEKQGIDYHFIDEQEFINKINGGFFLEHSTVYGTYYGSPASLINKVEEGTSYIMILDRAGTQRIMEQVPSAVAIWIYVGLGVLKERLKLRNSESHEHIQKRLALAEQEFAQEQQSPLFHYYVHNDQIELAYTTFKNILIPYLNQVSLIDHSPKLASRAIKNEKP